MLRRPAQTQSHKAPRLPFAVAATIALLAGNAAAAATSYSLQLNLVGGYANGELTACSLRHHYTFFHQRAAIAIDGSVTPTPRGTWQVKVKVKQCLRGRFRTVWFHHALGRADGTFKLTYPASRRGYFFARAYYYGVTPAATSAKQHFRVR
jgi:hypothetical protein